MSELRDAIEASLQDAWAQSDADLTLDVEAAVVLAMPEMQAIRKALFNIASSQFAHYSLPPSVVAWALDGER